MEYYEAKFVKITHYVQKNNLKEIFQTNIEGKVLLLHCISISALELESLASGCWQVFKVSVFSPSVCWPHWFNLLLAYSEKMLQLFYQFSKMA